MRSKSILLIKAGVLLLCLLMPSVSAFNIRMDSDKTVYFPGDTIQYTIWADVVGEEVDHIPDGGAVFTLDPNIIGISTNNFASGPFMGYPCDITGNTITCRDPGVMMTLWFMPDGYHDWLPAYNDYTPTGIFTITGTINSATPDGTVITSTASLSGYDGGGDPVSGDDQSINSVRVPGTIQIDSSPATAWIEVDGIAQLFLYTPATLDVTPGVHKVTVGKPFGWFNASREVTVTSGATSTVEFTLDPIPGALDSDAQQAAQIVLHDVLGDDTTGKLVTAYPYTFDYSTDGKPTVNGWTESVSFTDNALDSCSLIAVDQAPEANWEHLISYYCVDVNGDDTDPLDDAAVEKHDAHQPSTNLQFTPATGEIPSPGEDWQPDDPYVWTPACTNDCSNNYAVLISGGNDANHNYRRYWNDIAFMYINLKEYGYDPAHITVLMSDGGGAGADRCIEGYPTCTKTDDSPRNLDGIGTGDAGNETVLDADRTTILNKIESMRPASAGGTNPLPYGANLLIFTTGHGGVDASGNHYLYAWGGTGTNQYITDARLTQSLNLLTQVNSITLIMENCNSGGFGKEFLLSNQKRRIMYAAAADEPSWGNGFSNALTKGYAGHTRWYTSSCYPNTCSAEYDKGADADRNERVTANEAMAYARLNDPYYTSSTTPVPGKERSNIEVNSAAAADATSQYLSPCTGSASTSITVKDPAANVNWLKGTQHLITWDAKGLANRKVNITLLKSGATQKVIVSSPGVSASNPMKYCWNIPTDSSVPTSSTNSYSVRIQTADTLSSVKGTSSAFRIGAAPNPNQGSLKITVTEKGAATTRYLAPDYTVTNPCLGTIVASGRVAAASTGTTTPVISPQGNYFVGLILQGYYPVNNAPVTVAAGTVNVPLTMELIATNPNDVPPYGGIDVSSSPDGASIWIGRAGSPLTDSGYKTDYPEYYLAPGDYQVQVKKDGYINSDIRTVTVESMTSERIPVMMYFELTPLVQPYTVDGFSAPVTMNGVVNTANAGQTVPIKWHLADKNGIVSDPASFVGLYSYEIKCGDLSPVSTELKESPAGNSGLKNLGNGNWQFNWKTPKSYAGKCRDMFVRFNDGQELHALFKFK